MNTCMVAKRTSESFVRPRRTLTIVSSIKPDSTKGAILDYNNIFHNFILFLKKIQRLPEVL